MTPDQWWREAREKMKKQEAEIERLRAQVNKLQVGWEDEAIRRWDACERLVAEIERLQLLLKAAYTCLEGREPRSDAEAEAYRAIRRALEEK